MPLDIYEYYTPLHSFVDSYYQIDKIEKARGLWKQLTRKYQEQLLYFQGLSYERQYEHVESIMDNVAYYRDLIDALVENEDTELFDNEIKTFNQYIRMFPRFFAKQEKPQTDTTTENSENLLKELKSKQEIE